MDKSEITSFITSTTATPQAAEVSLTRVYIVLLVILAIVVAIFIVLLVVIARRKIRDNSRQSGEASVMPSASENVPASVSERHPQLVQNRPQPPAFLTIIVPSDGRIEVIPKRTGSSNSASTSGERVVPRSSNADTELLPNTTSNPEMTRARMSEPNLVVSNESATNTTN